MSDIDLSAGFVDSPKPRRGSITRDRVLQIARNDNIPDDIADDFAKVMTFESGGSHYDRRGKVKLSPPDPKTGERAVGISQIKPSTAREMGVDDPFDEESNLRAGLRYFAKGGGDSAGRRIHYFGGPKALQRYQRTGRIPKGGDVLGTTFEKYVRQTGGQAKAPEKPKIDLSAGFEDDDLAAGLEDSGQAPPPSGKQNAGVQPARPSVSPNQSRATSVPTQRYGGIFGRPEVRQAVQKAQPPSAGGVGELRRLDEPEVTRIQRLLKEEQARAATPGTFEYMGTTPRDRQSRVAEVAARRASQERATELRRQQQAPELERLTQQYRQQIRTAMNRGIGPEQWLNEAATKGLAGLVETAAGVVRAAGYNPLAQGATETADKLALHAEALQRAAVEEGADRNVVSRTIQDAAAGFASTAPEMAAMSLGVPAIPAFGVGGGVRAYGRGGNVQEVAKDTVHGAATGAAFELPIPSRVGPYRLTQLGQATAKAGTVGGATTGIELASGADPQQAVAAGITNAAFAGYGQLKHGGRRARKAETQPDVPAQPETAQSTQTSRQDVPARAVVGRGNVEGEPAVRSEPQTPRQWQHSDFGLVTESPNQKKVGKGRVRVVTENGREHIIKEAKLTGAGNQRAIPVKEPPAPNLESGIVETGAPPIRPLEAPAEVASTPEPRALPELKDNYRKPLKEYADRLYRETNVNGALDMLPTSRRMTDVGDVYLSNTADLALGQGANKGILLEFEPRDLQGQVNRSKPAWEPLYKQGQAEFVARLNKQGQYQQALTAVTIKPGLKMSRVERMQLDRALSELEQSGWSKSTSPDGSTTYRKSSTESKEVPESVQQRSAEGLTGAEAPAGQLAKPDVARREAGETSVQTYSPAIQEAFKAWNEQRAYKDNAGNYRIKTEGSSSGKIAPWNKEVKRLFPTAAEFHRAAKESLATTSSPEIEARVDRIIKEISDTPPGRTAQFLADEAGGLSLDKFKRAFKGKPSTPVPEGVALAAKRYSELADRMLGLNLKLGDAGGPSPKLSKAEVDALRREHREVLAKMMNVEKFIIDRGYKVNYLGEAAKRDESFPATLRNRPLIEKLKALFRDEEGSLDLDKLRERARQLLRENPDITDEMLKVRLTEPMRGEQASGLEQPKISDARERIRKTRPGEGGFAAVSSPAKTVGPVLREAQRAVQLEPPPVSKRIFAGIKRLPTTLQTALISEFTPLRKLEEAVRGKDVAVDMARKFEQVAGAPAKAEADFVDFKKAVVDPIRQHTDDFNAYLFLKRVEDRLSKDPEGKKVASWTTEKAQQGLKELEQSVGPETMARFEEIGKVYQDEMNRALQLQVESGRMTPELYDKIVNSSDFYAPFKVLKYIEQSEHGGGRNIATTQQLTKKITGIESEDFQVGNILQSSAEQIMRSRVLAEKNLKMRELAKLAETENDLIKKVSTDHHPRPGYEVVRYFENGKPQGLEVTADVAKAVRGLNPVQASAVAKVALLARRGLQLGATSANAGFQAVNLFFADLPRQALVSRYGLRSPKDIYQFPMDWAYSLATSMKGNFGKPNRLYMDWLRSGAANSTIQRELTPEVFRPKPISPGRTHPVRRVVNTVAEFSNAIEETSKILGLKRALRIEKVKDMTPEQRQAAMEKIAAEIRNYSGSPDFLRRGSETRNLNLLFMFFNARLQGLSSDIRRLAGKSGKPEAVAAWARLGTMVGVPATVLALVNNLPQYRDDYEKIPDWEKKNYFMIPRESFFRNDDGDMVRDYWRVPKRDIVGLFGNSIESFVAFAAKRDPAKFKDFASSTLESLSPVNIEGENLMERGESVAGSLNPLIKVPIETFSNRDFFRKRSIVPEYLKKASPELQYRKSTPKMYRAAGRALGVSPLRLEHMAEGFTGSGLGQFNIRRQPEGRSPVTGYPIIRRFVRSGAVKQDRSVSATERGIADKQVQRRELRQQMTDQERRGESPDIDSAVASGELTEADRKQIQREAKMSERQARFSDFIPAVALDRFERMDEGQREEVRDQMEKKAYTLLHSDSLTQDQKDAFAARIDALGITPQNPQSSSSSGGFRSRLRGFKSAFRETP